MPLMQTQDTEYKPWGLSAGAMVGQQQSDQEAANLLALQDSILGNTIKGVQAGQAVSDYSNPEMERLRQSGIMGKNQVDTAAGATAMGTQQSDMNAKIAKSVQEAGAAKTLTTINQLDNFTSSLSANGPAGLQSAIASIPDPAERTQVMQMIQQHGVAAVSKYFSALSNNLKTALADNPTVRGKIAEEKVKGDLHNKGIGMTNATNVKLEQMRIDAGKYNKASTAKSVEQMLIQAKSPTQKAEILEQAYYIAMQNSDVEGATEYKRRAIEARQRVAEDAAAKAAALGQQKPALQPLGIQTNPPNPAAPIAGGTAAPAAPADPLNIRKGIK